MNALMTIQVRVASAQARTALAQIQGSVAATAASASRASTAFGMNLPVLTRWGNQIQWIGRQMVYNFTLPLGIAGLAATNWALDNERAFTRVAKVYGDFNLTQKVINNELNVLDETFELLSSRFGVLQSEVIGIGAAWASAGSSGIALAKATKLTLQTMVLGEIEAAEATEALISIQAQYGLTIDQLTGAIQTLNMVENQTGATMQDLIDSFRRSAGVARAAGIDVRHLAAMTASLVPAAGSAANAGNALKTIISRLLSPTAEATEIMGLMGINTREMAWQTLNGTQRLELMADSFSKLSDAQRVQVATTIASRWQINKFSVLMDDIIKQNGYYQKALESTADSSRLVTQMTTELNKVLNSNPQRLKMVWTIMQNALANVIQPLIPSIVYLASVVADLLMKFQALDPVLQKVILGFAVGLGVLGIFVRYFGAIVAMVGLLGHPFKMLTGIVGGFVGALWAIVKWPFAKVAGMFGWMFGFIQRAALSAVTTIAGAFTALIPALSGVMKALITVFKGPWGLIITAAIAVITLFHDEIYKAIQGIVKSFSGMTTGVKNALTPVVDLFWSAVNAINRAFWALPQGVRDAILTVVRIVQSAAMAIYEFFSYINPFARHSPSLVESVIAGMAIIREQFASVANIGGVFARVAKDLATFKKMANQLNINPWSEERADVSSGLPQMLPIFDALVKDWTDLNKILDTQNQAVRAQEAVVDAWEQKLDDANRALDLQQDLLDSIEKELDKVQGQYDQHMQAVQDFANVGITGMRAMSDEIFANEMAQKELRLEIMRLEDAGQSIEDVSDAMASLQGEIEALRGEANDLRAAGAGSDVLNPILQQIEAMQDAYDAMADGVGSGGVAEIQKELERLEREGEMLDLENALQFDPLNRQIDQLAEGLNELTFDEIIDGINRERAAADALLPALEQLRAEAEAQQLVVDEFTAVRDALQKSYDDENYKLQILRDEYQKTAEVIRDVEEALRSMAEAASEANRAKEAAARGRGGAGGGLSAAGENFLAGAGADFADVGGIAGVGREGGFGDQSSLIEEFNKGIAEEIAQAMKDLDITAPIREKWAEFVNWWNTNVVPAWQGLVDAFGIIFGTIGDSIEDSGFLEKLSGIWTTISETLAWLGELFLPQFKEIWDEIVAAVGPAVQTIMDEFDKWGPQLSDLWNNVVLPIFMAIKTNLAIVAGVVLTVLSIIFNVIGNIIGPVIETIGNVIASVIQIIRGFIDVIVGIFTGDFSKIGDGLSTIFGGIWSGIYSILSGAVEIIWGILTGLVEGIGDIFGWFTGGEAGAGVGGWIDGIIQWFKDLPGNVLEWVQDVIDGIVDWFEKLPRRTGDALLDFWDEVRTFFAELPDKAMAFILDMVEKILTALATLLRNLIAFWTSLPGKILRFVGNLVSDIVGFFMSLPEKIRTAAGFLWTRVIPVVHGFIMRIGQFFAELPGKVTAFIIELVGKAITLFADWGVALIQGLGGWIEDVVNFWRELPGKVVAFVQELIGLVLGFFASLGIDLVSSVSGMITDVVDWFKKMPGKTLAAIASLASSLLAKGREFLQSLWNGAKERWEDVRKWLSKLAEMARTAIGGVIGALAQKGRDFIQGILTGVTGFWNERLRPWFAGLLTNIKTSIGSVTETLKQTGRDMLQGFINGVTSKVSDVVDSVVGAVRDAYEGVLDFLRTGSPSKLFMEVGMDTGDGLILGFDKSAEGIQKAAEEMLPNINPIKVDYDLARARLAAESALRGYEMRSSQTVVQGQTQIQYNFYGDLSFPNITTGDDAKKFVTNLETLAGGGVR